MGTVSNGLYTWTPARHASRLDSDTAHRRLDRERRRDTAARGHGRHHGLMARFGEWLGQIDRAPAYR